MGIAWSIFSYTRRYRVFLVIGDVKKDVCTFFNEPITFKLIR